MRSRWDDEDARAFEGELGQCVYMSRLLGRDHELVVHGGGNTSVKVSRDNILGEAENVICVKGSGWDLATIEPAGFTPLRLRSVAALAQLEELSDVQMADELLLARTDPAAPAPSVEAILHAVLPHRFVAHTHANTIVALTNTPSGRAHVADVYGDDVVVVPYVMPGFDLARAGARLFSEQAGDGTLGMVLMNHGLFTWGAGGREAYERMIALVARAEDYLRAHDAWDLPATDVRAAPAPPLGLAELRREISEAAGRPLILVSDSGPEALAFARRDDLEAISQQGPATPDHVLRTKRVPQVGRDVGAYVDAYRGYFERNEARSERPLAMLGPAPRVVLDPDVGLCALGSSTSDADVTRDIYLQTIEVILRATALERYVALPEGDVFDVEYWDLEQAKLKRSGDEPAFAGEVALVTGAATGIGRACVDVLLREGAAVVGLDRDRSIVGAIERGEFLGYACDVTQPEQVVAALDAAVRRYGGIDVAVLNAGVFPAGAEIRELAPEEWRRTMSVNLDANLLLLQLLHPYLTLAPAKGRVVVVGSKNVPAPGPGAAAYSASKAGLSQLARVAALEWGEQGIRVNVVHPDGVFDTGMWTDDLIERRAERYGVSVEQYRSRNVLRTEVDSTDVAELVAAMCGPVFAKTTGAQIPIDGGNERVI